MATSSGYKPN